MCSSHPVGAARITSMFGLCSSPPVGAARIACIIGTLLYTSSPVASQCAGSAQVLPATGTYQVFTSPNYPFSYANNLNCVWRIEATNATDAVRLEVTETAIEYHGDCVYDNGEVFDGYNVSANSMGRFCGTMTPNYVSGARYLTITFKSDYSLGSKGFKAQYKSGDRDSLLDKDDSSDSLGGVLIVGVATGSVVFLLLVVGMIYTCIHAKKAKESRRQRLSRGTSSNRVDPFMLDADGNHINGPPPPSYGDIYSLPMSPPPQYTEVDPNPEGNVMQPVLTEVLESDSLDEETNVTYADVVAGRNRDINANTHFNRMSTSTMAGTEHRIRNPQPIVRTQPLIRPGMPARGNVARPGVHGQPSISGPGSVQGQNRAQGQTGTAPSSNQRTASRQSIGANIGAIRALRGMRLNSLNSNSNSNDNPPRDDTARTARPNNPTQRDVLPNSIRTPSVSGPTNPFGLVEADARARQLGHPLSDHEADALSGEINSPRYPPTRRDNSFQARAPRGTTLAEVHSNAENRRRGSDVSEMSLPGSLSTISGSTVSASSAVFRDV